MDGDVPLLTADAVRVRWQAPQDAAFGALLCVENATLEEVALARQMWRTLRVQPPKTQPPERGQP